MICELQALLLLLQRGGRGRLPLTTPQALGAHVASPWLGGFHPQTTRSQETQRTYHHRSKRATAVNLDNRKPAPRIEFVFFKKISRGLLVDGNSCFSWAGPRCCALLCWAWGDFFLSCSGFLHTLFIIRSFLSLSPLFYPTFTRFPESPNLSHSFIRVLLLPARVALPGPARRPVLTMQDKKSSIEIDVKCADSSSQSSFESFENILNFRDVGRTINDFLGKKYV